MLPFALTFERYYSSRVITSMGKAEVGVGNPFFLRQFFCVSMQAQNRGADFIITHFDAEEADALLPASAQGFPFELVGMRLARIENSGDVPAEWRIETRPLSRSPDAFPGGAMVVSGPHVYLFAFTQLREGRQPRFLTRLPLSALEGFPADLEQHLETYTHAGRWEPGFLLDRAHLLMRDNGSEMSVEYYPEQDHWLAIYGSPVQTGEPADAAIPSNRVYARTARRLEGPWSDRRLIYRIPEAEPGPPSRSDPHTLG